MVVCVPHSLRTATVGRRGVGQRRKGGSPEGGAALSNDTDEARRLRECYFLTDLASSRALRMMVLAYSQLWIPQLPSDSMYCWLVKAFWKVN